MTFEEYLISKKIDREPFAKAETELYNSWKAEFEQIHPNSFTVQKLNLINPIRRKYPLKIEEVKVPVTTPSVVSPSPETPASAPAARPGKPVMKPKPKIN